MCSYSRSEEGCMPMSTVSSTADLIEFKSDPLARNLTLKKCQQKITTFDLKIKYYKYTLKINTVAQRLVRIAQR